MLLKKLNRLYVDIYDYIAFFYDDHSDNVFLLSKEEAKQYFIYDEARYGYSDWWLRSPHSVSYQVYFVFNDGRILDDKVPFKNVVRPALWIKL